MQIIPNIVTAKKYVLLSYIGTTPQLPNMRRAESELKKVLTPQIFAEVAARILANTPNELDIICQDFVANYAYYLALPDMAAQITDAGLRVAVTENMPSAAKWQFNEKREKLSEAALTAMDDLIAYMRANNIAENAAGWNSSEHCFMTGQEFAIYYPLQRPWATFQFLKPVIEGVERTIVHASIGEDFYKQILGASFYTNEADTHYSLVKDLRRAVALVTIARAVDQLSCRLTAEGFTVSYNKPDSPQSGDMYADAQRLSMTRTAAEKEGMDFLTKAKKYLDKNAAVAGPFADYYASEFYRAPTLTNTSQNATRNGVFGL
jgi:hypothetical protein